MRRSSVAACLFAAWFLASVGAGTGTGTAHAETPSYEGKTVTIVVGYAPGGGYDLYARLLSRYLGGHIPGKPTMVVQNMPGAAGVAAANNVFLLSPRDGTVIAAVDQNVPMFQLLGGEGARYDASRFNWLGVMASSNGLVMSWHASGIASLEDAKRRPVPIGSAGANDDGWVYARMLNALVGTQFNLISGYQGTSAVNVAIESGEVSAMARSSYFGFKAQKPDWLRDKKVVILVQLGFSRQPELGDVPLLIDLAQTDENRQLAALATLPTAIGYSHWMAAGVAPERVQAMRDAYAATMADPAMIAEAQHLNLVIRPKPASEVEALVARAAATPLAIRQRAAAILGWK